ncbi:MAG: hypothetical protein ABW128_07040 [Rhizorhabdus sp.]
MAQLREFHWQDLTTADCVPISPPSDAPSRRFNIGKGTQMLLLSIIILFAIIAPFVVLTIQDLRDENAHREARHVMQCKREASSRARLAAARREA